MNLISTMCYAATSAFAGYGTYSFSNYSHELSLFLALLIAALVCMVLTRNQMRLDRLEGKE